MADAGPTMALDESAKAWYRGRMGNSIALIMLLLLGFSCFILARWGAKGAIREEDELS